MDTSFSSKLGKLFQLAAKNLVHALNQRAASGQQSKTSVYEQNARDAYDAADDIIILIAINVIILVFRDIQYGTSYANGMDPIAEEFVAIMQDSTALALQTSAQANAFRDAYPRMMADSALSSADREAWINTHVQMAVAQSDSARVMSQRLRWILTELVDLWARALNIRRSGEVTQSGRVEAPWGSQATPIIATLLKGMDGSCMMKGAAGPEDSPEYPIGQTPRAAYEVFVRMNDNLNVMDRVWVITRAETIKIQNHLEAALVFAFYPPLMTTSLQSAADSYAEIAAYLIPYAREMQELIDEIGLADLEF
ncbi:hypothetical protein BO71DRAFT_400548 [Aspergillus ellipticus CBS 707.79]|uniref:Uncharacterized protein n=1 Tax=Aspergillus ellipticus CBS 707.79 TaxID=1448320 RepID=A0A319D5D8_9EURO|nr:hypothetical protein BO71DRAFT_400548 [Aspergillus ellipticus CBS 707.79]